MVKEKNNNTVMTVVVILLSLAVVGLVGFIIYDKTREPNMGGNDSGEKTEQKIDVAKLKEGVSKIINFNQSIKEDFSYLKLTKNGNLYIGIKESSTLYKKYSGEYLIATEVLDAYIFDEGNSGYQYIYALKNDGTVDRMEITSPAKSSTFEWEENYQNLKNIIYLDVYSDETPITVEQEYEIYNVYDQKVSAVDIDGNIYSLNLTPDSIWIKK